MSGLAGLPAGRYTSSGCELEILPDGRLVVAGQDQLLAGASLPIGVGVANVMRFAGVDFDGRRHGQPTAGRIGDAERRPCPGDRADLVLFDLPEDFRRALAQTARATRDLRSARRSPQRGGWSMVKPRNHYDRHLPERLGW